MPRRSSVLRLSLIASAVAFGGCVHLPAPKTVDSLALTPVAPTTTLVIVPTENTQKAIEFAVKNNANNVGRTFAQAFTDPVGVRISGLRKEQPLDTLISLLRANFKSVVKVDSLNEAKSQGADLIAMLDFYQDFNEHKQFALMGTATFDGYFEIDETLLLLDPSGGELGKISASAKGDVGAAYNDPSRGGFGSVLPGGKDFGVSPESKLYTRLEDEVMEKFQAALSSSTVLKDFLAGRANGAIAAAPAAAKAKPPRSDVDKPRYKLVQDPRKFAIVVGIDDYESLSRADGAERDAKAVRRHLLALGYPERNVILLTGRQASKSGLEKYLDSWLPRNVGRDDEVFFYFAGQGAPDPTTGRSYLMPWDGDAKFVDTTAYPLKQLYGKLGALQAKQIVVALDAGFSGTGERSVIAQGARPLVTSSKPDLPGAKIVALTAAANDETAGLAKSQAHGLFTYYFLKGLNERGGDAAVKPLFDFIKTRVPDAARREEREQNPQMLSTGSAEAFKL